MSDQTISELMESLEAVLPNYDGDGFPISTDEIRLLVARVRELTEALREAPMPERESTLSPAGWHEYYDEWWHRCASEVALGGGEQR